MTFADKVKALRALERNPPQWRGHATVRVLRNYTMENLGPLLRFAAATERVQVSVSFSDFDTFEQEVLDPNSVTNTEPAEIVLLSLWLDGLLTAEDFRGFEPATILTRVQGLVGQLKARTAARILVTTFFPPFAAVETVATKNGRGGLLENVHRLNAGLTDMARDDQRLEVIDIYDWSKVLGLEQAADRRFWYLYRAPLKNELLDLMAQEIAANAVALKCGPKKVIVLDCDETLWGGIVGEEGVKEIALGPESYPGSAYYDFHRQLLELKRRGVLLALCSKNNEADALEVFEHHPHSLLRPRDFSAWQINWDDKATNLRRLAAQLNLGTDSLVFVDDSPVECDFVRKALPEVTVLQRPERPCDLPQLLPSFRGFRMVGANKEDRLRSQLYEEEQRRLANRQQHASMESFLASLRLVARIQRAQPSDVGRVAQLTQKTNQFNLTTRRYTEGEIERLVQSPQHCVLTIRVSDRFGDYGLTGVAVSRSEGGTATVEAFLMSCRILGRQLEFAFLGGLLSELRRQLPDLEKVVGVYLPTEKNRQVADFYVRAGFLPSEKNGENFVYELRNEELAVPSHITVESQ